MSDWAGFCCFRQFKGRMSTIRGHHISTLAQFEYTYKMHLNTMHDPKHYSIISIVSIMWNWIFFYSWKAFTKVQFYFLALNSRISIVQITTRWGQTQYFYSVSINNFGEAKKRINSKHRQMPQDTTSLLFNLTLDS